MSKKILSFCTLLILFMWMGSPGVVFGQNASDAYRYSMEYPGGGAASMAMPGSGLTQGLGLGSTIDNPASAALFDNSGTFFGYSLRNVSESGSYLGNSVESSESHNSLSDIGFAYSLPTSQGSLVFGAGYVQTADYDRVLNVSGYNQRSTITDMYNRSGFYGDAAYNAFAIDSIGNGTQSVLRFGGFQGIEQNVQMTESGQMGELTGFFATEYQKNLYVGISLNIPIGSYTYERNFIERDSRNLYTASGPRYDVSNIISRDVIDANISGFSARIGFIYKVPELINFGMNYQFRSSLNVDEEYSTLIETTFDNGDPFDDSFTGEISYRVEKPARISAGLAFKKIPDVTVTLAGEWTDYGKMTMESRNNDQTNFHFIDVNQSIKDNYKDVINLKGGISYQATPSVRPYAGYSYLPSPLEGSSDKKFLSAGVNLGQSEQLNLNIGAQYAMWEDNLILYQTPSVTESALEDVGRLQVIVGLSYRF